MTLMTSIFLGPVALSTTLKYFYLENGKVRLQPANPLMKPIIIEDPSIVEIQGKVVLVIRQLA